MASARASVRGAEELGAADVPRAALQLQVAREEIVDAEVLMEDGDNELADARARRASEDADLAIALVRENQARTTAIAAKDRVHAAEAAEVSP